MKITTECCPDNIWVAIDEDTYDAESNSVGALEQQPRRALATPKSTPFATCSTSLKTAPTTPNAAIMREIIAPVLIEIVIVLFGIAAAVVIIKEIM